LILGFLGLGRMAYRRKGHAVRFTQSQPHRNRPYRGSGQKRWIKVKIRTHPAMNRLIDALSSSS
jgi:hypothetical protein